jgi:hypothetical protein
MTIHDLSKKDHLRHTNCSKTLIKDSAVISTFGAPRLKKESIKAFVIFIVFYKGIVPLKTFSSKRAFYVLHTVF